MTLVLGVDGGGTKTHVAVADETGAVRGFGMSSASNWELVGYEAAGAALGAAIREAFAEADMDPAAIDASVYGLAGVDFPGDEERLGALHTSLGVAGSLRFLNDSFVALRAGTNHPWGVVVISGTGSIAAGRNPAGETFRTLGQGPVFGDDSSASEISEAAVSAVAARYLERGPNTSLTERLCEAAGAAGAVDFLEGAARGRFDPTAYAMVVVDAAEAGDLVARRILEHAGSSLGDLAGFVARRLSMEDSEFELVLAGGMFRTESRIMRSALEATVKRSARFVVPVRLEPPPVVGAVLLALELAGLPTDPELHGRLAVSSITSMQRASA